MTLAIPHANQMGLPCPHRWLLGDSGRSVPGVCSFCGIERSFMGSWDEDLQQSRKYGAQHQTLRGAAKRSNARRLSRDAG